MNTSRCAIAGVGQTEFRRRHDKSLDALVVEAGRLAIADAGLSGLQIDGIITPQNQPAIDEIAAGCGIRSLRYKTINAYTPGAGPLAAVIEAQLAIRAGLATAVLITYGIKTSRPGGPYAFHAADPLKADLEMPVGFYGQPLYFAAMAQRYRHQYGLEPEHLAAVAIGRRQWAALTPGAQKPEQLTLPDYLATPFVAEPLRSVDCCLISDGAAAYVVTSLERARDLRQKPAVVAGICAGSHPWTLTEMFTQSPDFLNIGPGDAGRRAFAEAGVTPADVDVAQIYDCFTLSVILQLESLGFCPRGEGGRFVADGRTAPGGALPLNTNGGHLAHAYVPAATLVVEGVLQTRGTRGPAQVSNVEVSLVSTFGGPDHVTMILTPDR